ncbi:MAG: hypothetical protein ACI8RN_000947 [Glaciecola sp.]|jgi:hypothetical protein|uniref:hypothetical protein n=1 Tax=Congregibacter sp. TaxID=2744308 RepID=UPI0039E31C86
MRLNFAALFLALGLQLGGLPTLADDAMIEQELDQYWSTVVHYLAVGDYEGLVTTYHPDAVLVSESLGTSYPIAKALVRWKPGILATQAGEAISVVEFKVTERLFSETTSHEKGMFHFKTGPIGEGVPDADMQEAYVHFEALLLKNGSWTMVMEHQKQEATLAEWQAAQ